MSLRSVTVKLAAPALALAAVATVSGTANAAGPDDVRVGHGSYLLGIGYQHGHEAGARIWFYGVNCADLRPGDRQVFDRLPANWANRISSFTASPGCDALLYRKTYEGGDFRPVWSGTTADTLPGFANQTSSLVFVTP